MSLTDAEKTDIRRFCGYPIHGQVSDGFGEWGYYQTFGLLEYRLTNITAPELAVARRYLSSLLVLETAVPRAGDSLDTDQAAVWTRNKDEPRDRVRLFDDWRRRLCGFLGIPPGPALSTGGIAWLV
jgi:hypothetical protein